MGSGQYRATNLGAQMRADVPEGLQPLLDINSAGGRAELAFVELLGRSQPVLPPTCIDTGAEFREDLDANPELRRSFDPR